MTLTFDTAKHGIDMDGEVIRIVDNPTDLTDYSLTRNEAKDISEYDPGFKPCAVVTTAREALEAAWELAHEAQEIPAHTPNIFRASDTNIQVSNGEPGDLYAGHGRLRLIDPPEPEPEPWEESRYCYAAEMFFERGEEGDGPYWMGGDCCPQRYERDDMAKLNPRPVTIEGETK